MSFDYKKTLKKACGGGIAGASAMISQVTSLMWLRTTMNYQYRYGTSTTEAIKTLYRKGGIRRFYRGVGPALIQGPMSRFGDTAANAGVLALMEDYNLPIAVKTAGASITSGLFRMFMMPMDTLKTIYQVEGKDGYSVLRNKIKLRGMNVLYHGSFAVSAATIVGHYPWFVTYNYLNSYLPEYSGLQKFIRNAFIGFSASVISDTCSNSIRVVKTTKQTFQKPITYPSVIKHIVKKDGLIGLFGRGLKTRILSNGFQGIMFSVTFKYFMELYEL